MNESDVSHLPLFASLPVGEIEYLSSCLHPLDVPAGQVICAEGEPGDRFFMIIDGEVEVVKAIGTDDERMLGRLGPGDYIGEMSLLDRDGLRVASVRSLSAVHLLQMTHSDFDSLLQRRPSIAYEIARSLSLRLRDSENATIRDLQEKNRALAEAYEDLKAAQAQIIEKEKIERELQVARQIQQSILPSSLPHIPGLDLGAKMVPAKAVGGDLFDFICIDEDHLGVAIGDVSGKGVPAAIFMAMTRSLIRAEARRGRSPSEVLQGVNSHLMEMNDAGMFVTVLYGVLSRSSRTFTYARAGHELPVVCQSDGELMSPRLEHGQALGVFADPVLDENSLVLAAGSTVLIYTDGVTDAINEEGVFFGLSGLHGILESSSQLRAQEICDEIVQAVLTHQGLLSQHDDVTLVAVHLCD